MVRVKYAAQAAPSTDDEDSLSGSDGGVPGETLLHTNEDNQEIQQPFDEDDSEILDDDVQNDSSSLDENADSDHLTSEGEQQGDSLDRSTEFGDDDNENHHGDAVAPMFPNIARHSRQDDWLSARRGSWSAAAARPRYSRSRSPSRTPSPPDISLDLPPSYRRRRPQEPDHLPITDAWLFRGTRTRVGDLALADIVAVAGDVAAVPAAKRKWGWAGRGEVLCEYTWVETGRRGGGSPAWPAIYVPGGPPVWTGMLRGYDLARARRAPGVRDEHAQRQPLSPYEPTFRALEEAQAQGAEMAGQPNSRQPIQWRTVEVVSDANTLAQLFAFISTPYPGKMTPFRMELSTVRNTLFVSKAEHPRRGHTARGGRIPSTMPDWASDAVLSFGTRDASVPFSGGHWRVLRYRLGTMLCVVRAKVDFVYENRRTLGEAIADPLKGAIPKMAKGDEEKGDIDTCKTTVKNVGRGTQAAAPGLAIVRYQSEKATEVLQRNMPVIWFGRVPYVVDAAVSPKLEVREATLRSVRENYAMWEKQHQASLKRMAGLLKRLKHVTRGLGGSCVIVADPSQRCFTVLKPVIKRAPVPEEVAVGFWGEDDDPAETEYESTVVSDGSELSSLSRTPSGFEDWTLESQMEERESLSPEIHHRPSKQPRINSMGRVRGWLNRGINDPGYEPDSGDDGESDREDSDPIRPHDSISRRGLALGDAHSGSRLGYDGTIECEDDVDMMDGESEDDEHENEEEDENESEDENEDENQDEGEVDEDSGEESGSDWADEMASV